MVAPELGEPQTPYRGQTIRWGLGLSAFYGLVAALVGSSAASLIRSQVYRRIVRRVEGETRHRHAAFLMGAACLL